MHLQAMCRVAPGAPMANAARTKRQFCPSCSLVSSLLALLMSYTETESVRWKEFANAKTSACLEPKWNEKQWSKNLKKDIWCALYFIFHALFYFLHCCGPHRDAIVCAAHMQCMHGDASETEAEAMVR